MPRRTFYELHIRPMFRELDRQHMLQEGSQPDLWDAAIVKNKAKLILRFLESKKDETTMPPLVYGGPWPEEWVLLFNRWVSEGCPTLDLGGATSYTAQRAGALVVITAAVQKPGPNFAVWPDRYYGPPKSGVTPDLVLYEEPLDHPPPPGIVDEGVGAFLFPAAMVSVSLLDKTGIQTIPITPAGP
jgi:hypothetical protein